MEGIGGGRGEGGGGGGGGGGGEGRGWRGGIKLRVTLGIGPYVWRPRG